nr:MAG TPA: hypothetical protein [Caudoviricetes sp.]
MYYFRQLESQKDSQNKKAYQLGRLFYYSSKWITPFSST